MATTGVRRECLQAVDSKLRCTSAPCRSGPQGRADGALSTSWRICGEARSGGRLYSKRGLSSDVASSQPGSPSLQLFFEVY
jgi:hypothetical protein